MAMLLGNTEALDRVPFEVEFDKDAGLVAHDPGIMTGGHGENTGGDMVFHAAVAEEDADAAFYQNTHMGVHAEIRLGHGLHLGRPAETGGIDHAFHPGVAGRDNIQFNAADVGDDPGARGIGAKRGSILIIRFLLLDGFFIFGCHRCWLNRMGSAVAAFLGVVDDRDQVSQAVIAGGVAGEKSTAPDSCKPARGR